MEQENTAVALRYIEEVRNGRDFDVIDELFAPNHAHSRSVGADEQGIEARAAVWRSGTAPSPTSGTTSTT